MEQHYTFFCRCHTATSVELAVLRWLQAYVPAATGSVLNALCIAGYPHERTCYETTCGLLLYDYDS